MQYGVITDGTKALEFAKRELQKFVEKSCGFLLADYAGQEKVISLGVNEKSREIVQDYDTGDLNEDGFYILPKDGNVYIFGENEKGVTFGVYEFLEVYLGVRFLSRDCEYTPKRDGIFIEEKPLKRVPFCKQRLYLCSSSFEDPLVGLRYKYTADYLVELEEQGFRNKWYKGIPSSHNSNYYVPYEQYKDTNPEFFSVYRYEKFRLFDAIELCYTNGLTEDGEIDESVEKSVLSVTVDALLGYMQDDPQAKYFMFGRVDNYDARCHCPKCEKARREYGDSGIMIVFMNNVLKMVRKRLAEQGKVFDKKLVTFAYHATVDPPVKNGKPVCATVIPDKDLYIRYAPLEEADYTFALDDVRQRENVHRQISGWAAVTDRLMVWDYNCCFFDYFWYFSNLKNLQQDLRLFKKLGMAYVMKQGAYNIGTVWQDELKSYVCSKLFWDVDLDVKEIVREYVSIYFGLGGEFVLTFIEKMETLFAACVEQGLHLELGEDKDFLDPKHYPLDFLLEMETLLNEAIACVRNSELSQEEKAVYIQRLQSVLITPVRMIVRNAEYYFGEESIEYEQKFHELAKAIGVKKQGEVVPIFIDFIENGESKYMLITGQNPTKEELAAAEYIQRCIRERTGVTLPIEKDDKIYPAYWERGIMVGKTAMNGEFYKQGWDVSAYEYYVDVKGWCAFIDSDYDLMQAAEVFLRECLRAGSNANDWEIVVKKRVKPRKA